MKTRRFSCTLVATAAAAVVLLAGCIPPDEKPFDPRAMQHIYRDRAGENVTRTLAPLPKELDRTFLVKREGREPATRATSQPTTAASVGPAVRMSLRELVQLAAVNSIDVKVAGYQPAIDESRVIEAEARFDPSFFSNFNFSNSWVVSPSTSNSFFSSQTQSNFETSVFQTGFKQTLPNGAQVQLQYQAQRIWNRSITNGINSQFADPTFENSLALQITQPLLQNAGTEVNRARIVVARNTQRVSLLDFRLQLERTLSEIEEAYWQLVQAERELAIQEQLYNLTVETAEILQRRAGQDVSRVQLGQTNAALRFREAQLVELRNRLRTLSNAIKVRVNDPNLPVSSAVTILPEDRPILDPIRFDLAEQIEAGLSNRAELAQQQIRIDSATVVVQAAKNNLLPSLNLVGSIGTRGGDDNFGTSFTQAFEDFNRREYAIGLQLEVPLGNREPRAILRRTENQRMQAIWQYKGLIERVCQEVRDAHDLVYSAWERVRLTRQSTLAADDALDAINQEQVVGQQPLTPDFVNRKLQAQEQLAQAAREEARAITDYNTAISTLERAKGTILKYDNIVMQEEPMLTGGIRVRAMGEAR